MAVTILHNAIIHLCKEITMTNTILLLTHGSVGKAMLSAASNTLDRPLNDILSVSVEANPDPDKLFVQLETLVKKYVDNHLLILTDLFGATPCNIATKLRKNHKIAVVSGVNLGMLLRSINYIHLPFDELLIKAKEGGINSIKTCE